MVFAGSLGLAIRPFSSRSVLQTGCSIHRYAPRSARTFFWKSTPTSPAPIPAATQAVPPAASPATPPSVSELIEPVASSSFDASTAVEATETLISNIPPALQYGDLAALGLAGWSPAGIVRWSMELINVSTGMPWFWTIIVGSALWRFACVPWAIRGFQVSARLLPLQPQLLVLQKAVAKARETQNPLELQKAAQAMSRFYKSHNISPLAGLVSLVQLPVTFGLFFGVQKMCNFPVEQLRDSGVSFLPDLTASDPTMVLPLAMFVLVNTQIKLSVRDFNTTERPEMAHLMNILRLMTVPGIYLMSSLPSGLLISLLTTGLLTVLQTLMLRIPAVRLALKIPVIPVELQGKLPPFRDTLQRIRNYFGSDLKAKVDKARKEAVARERMERPRR